jgi:hypothetical protein
LPEKLVLFVPALWALVILCYIAWCVVSVLRAWSDPSARILRYCSLGILLLATLANIGAALGSFFLKSLWYMTDFD